MDTLSDNDVARLAKAVVAEQRALACPVLTLAEAMAHTKHDSSSAFYRWAAKWGVPRKCRYSRRALDRALELEAASVSRRPGRPPGQSTHKEAA